MRCLPSTTAHCLGAGLLALMCGCGSPNESGGAHAVVSSSGGYLAQVTNTPDPPRMGDNSLILEIESKDTYGQSSMGGRALVEGAALEISSWMPAHGHAGPTLPTATEEGAGVYLVDHLAYSMPGLWEVVVDLTIPSVDETDQFTIQVHVR